MHLSYTVLHITSIMTTNDPDLEGALLLMRTLDIFNLAVVVHQYNKEIVLVTYFPFSAGNCATNNAVVINNFDSAQHHWQTRTYFPKKLRNFHGCPLNAAIVEEWPYIFFERDLNGSIININGVLGEFLTFVSQNRNFTLNFYAVNKQEEYETYIDSGEILVKLFSKGVNISAGLFFFTPASEKPAHIQSLLFTATPIYIVINLQNQEGIFENYLEPLDLTVWIAISVTYGIGVFIICGFSEAIPKQKFFVLGRNNQMPHYNMFIICISGSVSFKGNRNFARFLFATWMLTTLVIRAAYTAGLYRMERVKNINDLPNNLEEVIAHDYEFILTPRDIKLLTNVTIPRFNVMDLDALSILQLMTTPYYRQRQIAALIMLQQFKLFNKYFLNSRQLEQLHIVPQPFIVQKLTFKLPARTNLYQILMNEVQNSMYYGFNEHWSAKMFYSIGSNAKDYIDDDESIFNNFTARETTNLHLEELTAVFYIYFGINLLAMLVFVMELVIYTRKNLKKC